MAEITMDMREYLELYEKDIMLRSITKAIYGNAKLSYNKKYLDFDDEAVATVLRAVDTDRYDDKLNKLLEEASNGTDSDF